MIWLLRILVVIVFAFDGPIILAPNRQSVVANFLVGLLTGLFAIWLSGLLGDRCKKVRARYPLGARRVGIALYVMGTAVAALCIGLAAFAAYSGAGRELIVVPASMSIVYWAAGWGLYRSLAYSEDRKPGETADVLSPLAASVGANKRHRKIALSLAILGALAAPFVTGAYKERPTSSVFVPITSEQKAEWAGIVQGYRSAGVCERSGERAEIDCNSQHGWERLLERGYVGPVSRFDILKYLATNVVAAVLAFAGVFVVALLIPIVVRGFVFSLRRYQQWLNA